MLYDKIFIVSYWFANVFIPVKVLFVPNNGTFVGRADDAMELLGRIKLPELTVRPFDTEREPVTDIPLEADNWPVTESPLETESPLSKVFFSVQVFSIETRGHVEGSAESDIEFGGRVKYPVTINSSVNVFIFDHVFSVEIKGTDAGNAISWMDFLGKDRVPLSNFNPFVTFNPFDANRQYRKLL